MKNRFICFIISLLSITCSQVQTVNSPLEAEPAQQSQSSEIVWQTPEVNDIKEIKNNNNERLTQIKGFFKTHWRLCAFVGLMSVFYGSLGLIECSSRRHRAAARRELERQREQRDREWLERQARFNAAYPDPYGAAHPWGGGAEPHREPDTPAPAPSAASPCVDAVVKGQEYAEMKIKQCGADREAVLKEMDCCICFNPLSKPGDELDQITGLSTSFIERKDLPTLPFNCHIGHIIHTSCGYNWLSKGKIDHGCQTCGHKVVTPLQ